LFPARSWNGSCSEGWRASDPVIEGMAMGKRHQGKAVAQKRSHTRDLTTRTSSIKGGLIAYNGHAGLGANSIVTDNKDPDGGYRRSRG
jgi:hypothetical protein